MKTNPEHQIKLLYHRLGSREFQPLLEDMLFGLKFTAPCENAGDMALNNFAKELVVRVFADEEGVVNSESLFKLVRKLIGKKKK